MVGQVTSYELRVAKNSLTSFLSSLAGKQVLCLA